MQTQQKRNCSKSTIETLIILVFLLLNLNIFHTFLQCLYFEVNRNAEQTDLKWLTILNVALINKTNVETKYSCLTH